MGLSATLPFSSAKLPGAKISHHLLQEHDSRVFWTTIDARREGEGNTARILELEAPVWKIVETQGGQMILDDQPRAITQPLQCVLVGRSKVEPLQAHYVLLVQFAATGEEGQAYERVESKHPGTAPDSSRWTSQTIQDMMTVG
jgi:hypothetical protein